MRAILGLLVLIASAAGAHYIVLNKVPSFVMTQAHEMLEEGNIPLHQWVQSPRQTPQTQQVVRPSPDLAYAICRFDTASGPVAISAPIWDGYGSISIFNGETDNIFVGDGVIAGGSTKLMSNVPAGRTMLGYPATQMDKQVESYKALRRLPRVLRDIKALQKAVFKSDKDD